jgi:hypothetical protein
MRNRNPYVEVELILYDDDGTPWKTRHMKMPSNHVLLWEREMTRIGWEYSINVKNLETEEDDD